jgi:hypothetical protein
MWLVRRVFGVFRGPKIFALIEGDDLPKSNALHFSVRCTAAMLSDNLISPS